MKSFQLILLAVVFIVGAVVGSNLYEPDDDDDWTSWKAFYSRGYASDEEEVGRKVIWEDNMATIAKHNLNYQLGVHSYRLAMNQFGDLKPDEFLRLYTGLKKNITRKAAPDQPSAEDITVPSSVDWRKKGYVTAVKDQMSCGSCWAFSATGALEGQHFKKTGKLVSLSEQNLVDCSGKEGNQGCDGGLMEQAFQYVIDAGGIDTETSYPYFGMDGPCTFEKSNVGATCTGYTDVLSGSERALKKAVAKVGPISVAIDATSSFQFYSHGIFSDSTCSTQYLDHGVLAVGYGSSSGQDYWIVKNSWSRSWGMRGYILMSRNKDNQCGIATDASYPLV